jgi:hypothetical protein
VAGTVLLCYWTAAGAKLHGLDSLHGAFLRRQVLIFLVGLAAISILAWWPGKRNGRVPALIFLGWTAVDLLCFATGYNPSIPRELYYPTTPAIEWLKKDNSLFRVFGGGTMLPPNSAEVFGLSDARGCDFMTVKNYEMLITGKADEFFFYRNPETIPEAFPLLNVKYLFGETPLRLSTNLYELVYSKEILIYKYKQCLDRALLVFNSQVEPDRAATLDRVRSGSFDPRQVLLLEEPPAPFMKAATVPTLGTEAPESVRITSYEPDVVKIDASLPRPGFLLLLDTYFPGWSATVNGRPSTIHRADYNFRAVSLPEGKSNVCFYYRPQSFRIGLYCCGAGLLALVAACIVQWKRRGGGSRLTPQLSH